ncbi:3-oxoacyl-[acyl-carrier-protein] synthase III C-terminal domain-containing protein [Burkholderia ubonensis]|uniref:3-oxoacyl-[acyl-carrier-protein] synthase III C-terminal domain-containing protein n=1 Tax=Burkholderia ubonensis TaxID=101571 RepID=UPI0012F7AE88
MSDIDLTIPHQPHLRIVGRSVEQLGLPRERCVVLVDQRRKMTGAAFSAAWTIARE